MKATDWRNYVPTLIALLGVVMASLAWINDSLYMNYYLGAGVLCLFFAWLVAIFIKKEDFIKANKWEDQKKAMIAMTMCLVTGLSLLIYYEMQMPKYDVALISKQLYKVPPQLNSKQLRKYGAECNMEGDTLCAHAVFAKIVKKDPRDYHALANLAMAQSHLGFHKNAIANFKIAISNGIQKYDVYKLYGNSLLITGNKERAIKSYSASLMKNPQQHSLRKKVKKLIKK